MIVDSAEIKKFREKYSAYNRKVQHLLNLLDKLSDDKVWSFSAKTLPRTVSFEFIYPNGKAGDIDMYISSKYGNVIQVDTMIYRATFSSENLDIIIVMLESYVGRKTGLSIRSGEIRRPDRSELTELSKHNNYLKLYNAKYCGLANSDELYRYAHSVWHWYREHLRQQRKNYYSDAVANIASTSHWKSEQEAFALVRESYPDAMYQYQPEWLEPQSLDIFIPSLSLGIEYQGAQHYKETYYNKKDGLRHVQKLDRQKRRLCKDHDVKLIEWRYDQPLTAKYILSRIKRNTKNASE